MQMGFYSKSWANGKSKLAGVTGLLALDLDKLHGNCTLIDDLFKKKVYDEETIPDTIQISDNYENLYEVIVFGQDSSAPFTLTFAIEQRKDSSSSSSTSPIQSNITIEQEQYLHHPISIDPVIIDIANKIRMPSHIPIDRVLTDISNKITIPSHKATVTGHEVLRKATC
ncbi:hypothetical protein RCL_jg8619.t1 [Rhizophagus clarus]|nr:hypothetical protein RCL_jg8619.t1 [Rhizophagus clarus]